MECSASEKDFSMEDADDDDEIEEEPDVELETGLVLTRLNEVVRKQYFGFLEKLLQENYATYCLAGNSGPQEDNHIHTCATLLEDKAIKSCMMVQLYRKAMVKIIANVRRSTEQRCLQHNLRLLLEKETSPHSNDHIVAKHQTKATQTDDPIKNSRLEPIKYSKLESMDTTTTPDDDFKSYSLHQKMQMFQARLHKEAAKTVIAKIKPRRKPPRHIASAHSGHRPAHKLVAPKIALKPEPKIAPKPATVTVTPNAAEVEDEVAQELAQLFNEENNEIDEIFGFDANEEPDDPRIKSILNEIQNAKLSHEQTVTGGEENLQISRDAIENSPKLTLEEPQLIVVDLRNSLWPCELYMQRRNLSETLARLVDEDFRWSEVIKWKFLTLFGEDSDDEFASCSPSIELDEVLISSCVRRISPWVVKHLMYPMNEGLIANRFLFKKLAKKLSRRIILENQYPGENMIKDVIENFFCVQQAVSSTDDLEIPFTLFTEDL